MMLGGIILLLAGNAIIASAASLYDTCPEKGSLTSCYCSSLLYSSSITCNAIKSLEELKSDFELLKNYDITSYSIEDVVIPRSDADFFKGLQMQYLQFSNVSVIEEIKEGLTLFKGLENLLKLLDINKSFHTGSPLKYLKLDHMEKLEVLMLTNNRIEQIGNDWFRNGPKPLYNILINNNGIKTLGSEVFSSLENLQILQMTGNSISELSRSMFPRPAKKLGAIDLSNNRIEKLPRDLFEDMPFLWSVYLRNNSISTISEDTWPKDAAAIYLEGNPLHCDDDLKWLCKIGADHKKATCNSPPEKRGMTLRAFCDM